MLSKYSKRIGFRFVVVAGMIISLSVNAFAQTPSTSSNLTSSKWKVAQFDFGFGFTTDRYNNMSLEHLMEFANSPDELQRDLTGLRPEVSSKTTGGSLLMNISLVKRSLLPGAGTMSKKGEELRLGLGIHSPKEAMISYKNEERDTSIVYCNLQKEITLEAAYLWHWTFGNRDRFVWYIGSGLNTSASYDNEMQLILGQYFEPGLHPSSQESFEENRSVYGAKTVLYARFYVPFGIHMKMGENWSFGFVSKRGFGLQSIVGGSTNYIRRMHSLNLGAKFLI